MSFYKDPDWDKVTALIRIQIQGIDTNPADLDPPHSCQMNLEVNSIRFRIGNFFFRDLIWRRLCRVYTKHSSSFRSWHQGFSSWFYSTIGWSSTFCYFRKRALCCQSGIFLWVQFQKIGEFGRAHATHARQSFHFQKWIFFIWICRNLPYTSKNDQQK